MKNENFEAIQFSVLKKHEDTMESSLNGKMTELLQLCKNELTQEHFYTYEVLDTQGQIVGGRLFYNFNNPNEALEQWNAFTSDNGLDNNIDVVITKQEINHLKKIKIS